MDRQQLTQAVKEAASAEGFDLAGVAPARLPDRYGQTLSAWLERGDHGAMGYMERTADKRSDAQAWLPGARSVIVLAKNYNRTPEPRPAAPAGRVARYAWGRDYHKILGKAVERLCGRIRELAGEGVQLKMSIDAGPVLERAYAREAGIGFYGKNTNVIAHRQGSWLFLACVLTDLDLVPDEPHAGSCGTCTLCIEACPTQALHADYRLEATRCISYWTIEAAAEPPAELAEKFGDWVYGCDICQEVCPYNRRAPEGALAGDRRIAGSWLDLATLEALRDDSELIERYAGSPIRRAKRDGLVRNARLLRRRLETPHAA